MYQIDMRQPHYIYPVLDRFYPGWTGAYVVTLKYCPKVDMMPGDRAPNFWKEEGSLCQSIPAVESYPVGGESKWSLITLG
jgi:hypothetical protein